MLSIDTRSRKPIYEQVYISITKLAITGAISAHDKLPSVRQVAKDFGINPNTVSKAYTILEQEGIIYSVPGRGCFVSESDTIGKKLKEGLLKKLQTTSLECKAVNINEESLISVINAVYKGEDNA